MKPTLTKTEVVGGKPVNVDVYPYIISKEQRPEVEEYVPVNTLPRLNDLNRDTEFVIDGRGIQGLFDKA